MKRHKRHKRSVTWVLALLLTGCAAPSPNTQLSGGSSPDSLALQVMKANRYSAGLKDVEIDQSATVGSEIFDDLLDAALLREHLLGRASALPGTSSAAMSAFFFLELLNDQTALTRLGSWMPLWMPGSLAPNPQQAQLRVGEIVEQAAIEALPPGYRTEPYEWTDKAILGPESRTRVLRVDGPLCEQWSCVIRGSFSSRSHPEISYDARMVETLSPAFLRNEPFFQNDEKAYRYQQLGGVVLEKVIQEYDKKGLIAGYWHYIETEPLKNFDYSGFYQRFSASLPNWAFIYFGPQFTHNEAGIPFILNRGKQLLFVKPTSE